MSIPPVQPSQIRLANPASNATSNTDQTSTLPRTVHKHIWILTGPSGSGKSTVAEQLSQKFQLRFLEGDDFHPKENIELMRSGHPLTDADRWSWLASLRRAALHVVQNRDIQNSIARHGNVQNEEKEEVPHENSGGVVVITCSALRKVYRDILRGESVPTSENTEIPNHVDVGKLGNDVRIHFVFLALDKEELGRRLKNRKDHYMKENMLASQLATLEEPDNSELQRDTIKINAGSSLEEVEEAVQIAVKKVMEEDAVSKAQTE